MSHQQFFSTTAKGLESLLAQEITTLGGLNVKATRAGVAFEGPLRIAYQVCLWSRVANRVFLPLKTFHAPTPEKLYGGAKSIRWSEHLSADRTFSVDFVSVKSQITHTHFGALKVKDAIVDQFRSVHGQRPSIEVRQPDLRVHVYLNEDQATLSLDLSGESLHRRGYREEGAKAPLKETLAAALLLFSDWPKFAKEGKPFIDPMCGSGTLLTEAASIAANRAPGLGRDYFGFIGWLRHDPQLWKGLLKEARELEVRDHTKLPLIQGSDSDPRALRAAQGNIERSGWNGLIRLERKRFEEVVPPEGGDPGLVLMNPPYGERLDEVEELLPLYKTVGDRLKKLYPGWKAGVLTSSPELGKAIGLKPSRKTVVFNGALECRLFIYDLFSGSEMEKRKARAKARAESDSSS